MELHWSARDIILVRELSTSQKAPLSCCLIWKSVILNQRIHELMFSITLRLVVSTKIFFKDSVSQFFHDELPLNSQLRAARATP